MESSLTWVERSMRVGRLHHGRRNIFIFFFKGSAKLLEQVCGEMSAIYLVDQIELQCEVPSFFVCSHGMYANMRNFVNARKFEICLQLRYGNKWRCFSCCLFWERKWAIFWTTVWFTRHLVWTSKLGKWIFQHVYMSASLVWIFHLLERFSLSRVEDKRRIELGSNFFNYYFDNQELHFCVNNVKIHSIHFSSRQFSDLDFLWR